MARGLGRRPRQRRLRRDCAHDRLHDRLEDRQRDLAAGLAVAERALALGVVVADPDHDGDVVAEAGEPGVVEVVAGAGLAADIGRQRAHARRRAARHHALQEACGAGTPPPDRPRRAGAALRRPCRFRGRPGDLLDHMRRRALALVGDRRIERREVDRPHRLGAEHERIVPLAFRIDARLDRRAGRFRRGSPPVVGDAAVEQPRGDQVLRHSPARGGSSSCRTSRRRSCAATSSPRAACSG